MMPFSSHPPPSTQRTRLYRPAWRPRHPPAPAGRRPGRRARHACVRVGGEGTHERGRERRMAVGSGRRLGQGGRQAACQGSAAERRARCGGECDQAFFGFGDVGTFFFAVSCLPPLPTPPPPPSKTKRAACSAFNDDAPKHSPVDDHQIQGERAIPQHPAPCCTHSPPPPPQLPTPPLLRVASHFSFTPAPAGRCSPRAPRSSRTAPAAALGPPRR